MTGDMVVCVPQCVERQLQQIGGALLPQVPRTEVADDLAATRFARGDGGVASASAGLLKKVHAGGMQETAGACFCLTSMPF